ncbi:alginate export family protein [Candidatus Pacearchaeota archaeon]|nr:alginate export family protein [Candidatus Pacearchaeota archaeon]
MKKTFIISTIFLLLVSTYTVAQTTFDVTGQVRPRLQINNKDFNSDTKMNTYTELRTRLGVKFTPTEDVTGFIQFQDSRVFGTEPNTLADTKNLDLHQGYFDIKKIFKLPLNFKVGRMELSYGPQRLIGAVGWHNVGRSFDGGVIKLVTKSVDIDFVGARTNETMKTNDSLDYHLYTAYANLKLVKDYKLQPFIIGETRVQDPFKRYTLGFYVKGEHDGFSYEAEAAYQIGTQQEDVSIAAYMFALNLYYKFKTKAKPMVSAGIDYLSGDDGNDTDKYKVFNTLYATNHKYYGYMDYFLNIPNHTYKLGLMDIHGKASIMPFDKFTLAAAFHLFSANEDYTLVSGGTSTSFGSELDITFIYGYSKLVKFVAGFSMFSPGDIFKETKGEDSANWAYLMAIVNL